ncbi:MAG: histidine kinase [Marinilabiliaceae bacterium]|nr:histidine kinase [Marinilabiliaceae bacterium]
MKKSVKIRQIRVSPAAVLFSIILIATSISLYPREHPKKWSETYSHRHFALREGLPESQVFYAFQDKFGYIWFSTFRGVSRFDGLNFENFSSSDLQIDAYVRYYAHYGDAVVLIATRMIIFYHPNKTMEFFPIPEPYTLARSGHESQIIGDNIFLFNCFNTTQTNMNIHSLLKFNLKNKTFSVLEDYLPMLYTWKSADDKIYALPQQLENRQLPLYRLNDNKLQIVHITELEDDYNYLNMSTTSKNEWYGSLTKSKPHRIDDLSLLNRFYIENETLKREYIMSLQEQDGIRMVENLDDNRYIIGVHFSLFILNIDENSLTPFPLETRGPWKIIVDNDGSFWLACEDGIYHCTKNFMEYKLGLSKNDNIWGAIKDINNNVWFSSYDYGFWRADKDGFLHEIIPYDNGKKISTIGYMSTSTDKEHRIYLPFHAGIAVHDPNKMKPNHIKPIMTGVSLSIYYDEIRDAIFFGGHSDTCKTLNMLKSDGQIVTYPFDNRHIISLCRDGNNNLRIGTFYGIESYLDEENGIIVNDTTLRPYNSVECMAVDKYGTLWKGGLKGLFAENIHGVDKHIFEQTTLFVANYHNRYIIFGTNPEVHILDLELFHAENKINIRTFGYYDGFDVWECGQNGISIDHEGYVWVCGTDKVVVFHPDELMKKTILKPRKPFIAAIYSSDRGHQWQLVSDTLNLHTKYKENNLRFDILLAEPSMPDKVIFRYRLNGFDDRWQISNDRTIIFQNLPFGEYQLEVQSSLDQIEWSDSAFSQYVEILPPFLLSKFGLLLILLFVASTALLIVNITKKIIRKKEEAKRQIDKIKFKAVQAKFIPHFTGNVLNSVNYLISINPDLAQKYVADFADFSNKTIFNSDTICRSIQEELEYVQLYLSLEKLRFEERLEYEINVAKDVDPKTLIPTMAMHTFCENALKHGLRTLHNRNGKILINIYRENSHLIITVQDNGIGREKAKTIKTEGTKEGLKIIAQHLEIFSKDQKVSTQMKIIDLFDDAHNPAGTLVELRIEE